jgi:hypothetical protein
MDAAANSKNAILERALFKRDYDQETIQACYNRLIGACSASGSSESCYQGSCSSECADHDPWSRSCCNESGGDLTALSACQDRKAREYNATAASKFATTLTFTPTASAYVAPATGPGTTFSNTFTDQFKTTATATATANASAKTTAAPTVKPTAAPSGATTTSPNAGERLGSGGAVQLGMAGSVFAWGLSLLLL